MRGSIRASLFATNTVIGIGSPGLQRLSEKLVAPQVESAAEQCLDLALTHNQLIYMLSKM